MLRRGALLIDIRDDGQRAAGEVPIACIVPRNSLEWRLDPACEHRDRALARRDVSLVVMCEEGYQSSQAAAAKARPGYATCCKSDEREGEEMAERGQSSEGALEFESF